ncbi:hypothetical protein OIDMADRAFT_159816 [Oidiodendron maius Zn]|uniref:Nitrate/nitrite transporter n=1 Tax=Oidiodendron maius (strain Zn) TaxID=913774 RepID=A0A0C3CTX3_OIDMZ|nr:hypothetical protein OIDMADRAFT_159816 [Oidiodendron maius Zn]
MATGPLRLLFASPTVNPTNHKAKSIPVLNPLDPYGRVFFFSWLGFMVAFLSWYAFPPLLTVTIKKDLKLSQTDVANSNIVALLATFLIRFISGPLCDRFGPRLVFVGILLAGSIPTAMAGLVTSSSGLIALRFFVGILGASFVPCQVWTTGFFDKDVIGTANALTAGWGNAGGGITYFVMPAVFDSLVQHRGLTAHKAWRVAYIVPFIINVAVALGMLLTCTDTPTGKWSERKLTIVEGSPVTPPLDETKDGQVLSQDTKVSELNSKKANYNETNRTPQSSDLEIQLDGHAGLDAIHGEVIVAPTLKEVLYVVCSLPTLTLVSQYACSFGAELALDGILGSYYLVNFPHLGQTKCGQWAAMFGLLNVLFRPLGGYISDLLYRHTSSLWVKKLWLVFLGVVTGVFLLAAGLSNPKSEATMFGLFAGLAFFLEAANGANFSLVPHVYPAANGIVSGTVGAAGNLGGIIFNIIFRYNGAHYDRSVWTIGVISIAINLAVSWIRPVP